jgi:hypothetical protein
MNSRVFQIAPTIVGAPPAIPLSPRKTRRTIAEILANFIAHLTNRSRGSSPQVYPNFRGGLFIFAV